MKKRIFALLFVFAVLLMGSIHTEKASAYCANPVIQSFKSTPSTASAGNTVVVSWDIDFCGISTSIDHDAVISDLNNNILYNIPQSSGVGSRSFVVPASLGFNLRVTSEIDGSQVSDSFSYSVPPTVNLTVAPNPAAYCAASQLQWSSSNATSCTGLQNFSTGGATSGSTAAAASPGSYVYIVQCTGPGGSTSKSVSFTRNNTVGTNVNVTVTGAPSATWTVNGNDGSSTSGTGNMSRPINPQCGTTYTLTPQTISGYNFVVTPSSQLTTDGNNISFSVVYTASPTSPPLITMKLDGSTTPMSYTIGQSGTITWHIDGTRTNMSCNATGGTAGWPGSRSPVSGTDFSYPIPNFTASGTYTYTLSCTNPDGMNTKSVTANVSAAPTQPIDLIAGAVSSPDFTTDNNGKPHALPNQNVNLTTVISNTGSGPTGAPFNVFFESRSGGFTKSAGAMTANSTQAVSTVISAGSGPTIDFRACADHNFAADTVGIIAEGNEGNNCSQWLTVSVSNSSGGGFYPDVEVVGFSHPPTAIANTDVYIDTQIGNGAGGTTPVDSCNKPDYSCKVYAFAQIRNPNGAYVDATPSSSAFGYIGLYSSTTINPRLKYRFPGPGTYGIRVCADKKNSGDAGYIDEGPYEGNNCSPFTDIDITAAPSVDLTAGQLVANTPHTVGTPMTFSSVITNNGNVSTGSGNFSNLFQFNTIPSGIGATMISVNQLTPLAANTSNTSTSSPYKFTVPNVYYIRACADNDASMSGTITESDEGNNCSSPWTVFNITSGAFPDLTGGTPVPNSPSLIVGTPVTFSAEMYNYGPAGTGASFPTIFQIYPVTDPTDVRIIGSPVSPALKAYPDSVRSNVVSLVTTPAYTFSAPGAYYARTCADKVSDADINGSINEGSPAAEGNNCTSPWMLYNVAPQAYPDLTGGTPVPNSPMVTNSPITFSAEMFNYGPGDTVTSFPVIFQMARQADKSDAQPFHSTTSPALKGYPDPVRSNVVSLVHTPAQTFIAAGPYYFRTCADNNASMVGVINEGSPAAEGNNCTSPWIQYDVTTPTSGINLRADDPLPNQVLTVNTPVNFSSMIRNVGTAPANTAFLTRFEYSSSPIGLNPTPISANSLPGLAAGASLGSASNMVSFPTPGQYYVRACTDNDLAFVGTITESNEGDNCSNWAPMTIITSVMVPTATLTAVPATIASGGSSLLTWTSTNSTSCTGVGFNPPTIAGSMGVSPTVSTTYEIRCSNATIQSAPRFASVTVNGIAPPLVKGGLKPKYVEH